MDATKILTREEISQVLDDLNRRADRSIQSFRNLIVFRLSCCCGLRAKEIAGLNIGDIAVGGPRPCIRVRKAIIKGRPEKRRGRIVPLWWDEGTLEDVAAWLRVRLDNGAQNDSPFVCGVNKAHYGCRLKPIDMNKRWTVAIRCLGPERVEQLSVHCGRHSFCSHALYGGYSLAEVRDAAGHRSVGMTSIYLHSVPTQRKLNVFSRKMEEV